MIELQLSLKGTSPVNEDMVGHHQNHYWVMDGVTDLFGNPLFQSGSDAARLVGLVSDALAETVDEAKPLEVIVAEALEKVREQVGRISPAWSSLPAFMLPTFTLVLVRVRAERHVDYLLLGDSALVFEQEQLIRDQGLPVTTESDRAFWANLSDPDQRQELLRVRRRQLNQEGGYWIGSLDGAGLAHAVVGQKTLQAGQGLLLATDGFTDFFSPEQLTTMSFSPDQLMTAIGEILRQTEQMDLSRFKQRDDLTILVLR